MAGGLVGAILGGGNLGWAFARWLFKNPLLVLLLAKAQAQGGELSDVDKAALQQVS